MDSIDSSFSGKVSIFPDLLFYLHIGVTTLEFSSVYKTFPFLTLGKDNEIEFLDSRQTRDRVGRVRRDLVSVRSELK